ncbi:MAG: SMI1/KNR4 family protein [Bacilli bacterium]
MYNIINNIEETFNIKLPQHYIEYMKTTNGYTGIINEKYYDIWNLEDIVTRNNDYHV